MCSFVKKMTQTILDASNEPIGAERRNSNLIDRQAFHYSSSAVDRNADHTPLVTSDRVTGHISHRTSPSTLVPKPERRKTSDINDFCLRQAIFRGYGL